MLFSLISASVAQRKDVEPIFECPKGWEFHGELCRRRTMTQEVPYCGERATLIGDKCVRTAKPLGECMSGSLQADKCSSIDVSPPTSSCPPSYSMVTDSKKEGGVHCEKSVSVPGPQVCPRGTIDEGKNCVKYEYSEPVWECPPGEYLDGLFCVSEQPYDCSHPVVHDNKKLGHGHHGVGPNEKYTAHYEGQPFQRVPQPQMVSGKEHTSLRRLGEKDLNVVGPKYDDIHVVREVERWCIRQAYTMAVAQCPKDTLNDGKRCQKRVEFDREEAMPIMTYFDAEIETVCPTGYNWCMSENKKHHEFVKDKNAADYVKKHAKLCCHEHIHEPTYMCPEGYKKMADGQCARYYDPVMICPNSKKDGKKKGCQEWEYMEANIRLFANEHAKKEKKHGGHHH